MSISIATSLRTTLTLIVVNVLLVGALVSSAPMHAAETEDEHAQLCACVLVEGGICMEYEEAGCSDEPPQTCGVDC